MILEYYCLPHCKYKPVRANPSDAGLDLRFNPNSPFQIPLPDSSIFLIDPGESIVFSTGLKFGIPHGYMLQIMNRSGNAAKKQLIVGACVVDSGYDGEIFVNLHNIGTEGQMIRPGMKIAQAVLIPIVPMRLREIEEDNLYGRDPITISDRGDGALGSTGD